MYIELGNKSGQQLTSVLMNWGLCIEMTVDALHQGLRFLKIIHSVATGSKERLFINSTCINKKIKLTKKCYQLFLDAINGLGPLLVKTHKFKT